MCKLDRQSHFSYLGFSYLQWKMCKLIILMIPFQAEVQKFKYFFFTKAFYSKDKNSLAEGSLTSRPKHISVHYKQGKVKIFQLSGSL